jgi:transcriptional regulator with XRE-family HTH domain
MIRKSHGLTLAELATAVGVTISHLSRVETGERVASEGLLLRVANHLATLPKTSP